VIAPLAADLKVAGREAFKPEAEAFDQRLRGGGAGLDAAAWA
jgi:hypothetical protein